MSAHDCDNPTEESHLGDKSLRGYEQFVRSDISEREFAREMYARYRAMLEGSATVHNLVDAG